MLNPFKQKPQEPELKPQKMICSCGNDDFVMTYKVFTEHGIPFMPEWAIRFKCDKCGKKYDRYGCEDKDGDTNA
jgi:hypothetical protein